jgi:serine protease Do
MISSPHKLFRSLIVGAVIALAGAPMVVVTAADRDADVERAIHVKLDTTPLPRPSGGELSYAPVVKLVTPSVVKVVVRENGKEVEGWGGGSPMEDPMFRWFFGPNGPNNNQERRMWRQPPREGLGSGVIVSSDGYIVTNNHVIDGADKVTVTLADGREIDAKVIGADDKTDVAVIQVNEKNLPAITFADSESIEVGDRVLAVGNPFNFGQTVTSGIISGKSRSSAELGLYYQDFIQTDAAINPGNSGGALVDMRGRLIGVNTAIYSRSGGFQGIGFAIPADMVRSVMNSLVQHGKVTRGFLGVGLQDLTPALAEEFDVKDAKGVVVSQIEPDSPAAKAGLQDGDVLTEFNGARIENTDRFRLAVANTPPGTQVKLTYVRGGEEHDITVQLAEFPGEKKISANEKPESDTDVLHGVHVTDLTPQLRSEFEVPARIKGALVIEVPPNSASAEAGLAVGDVLLQIDGKTVTSAADAVALTETSDDRKTLLRIWSRGGTHFLVVDETDR